MKGHVCKPNKVLFICAVCFGYLLIQGCASMKEATKGFLGVSTRELEEARKGAINRVFALDYGSCYQKTKEALKEKGGYIYRDDPAAKMIALYVSGSDTTPVGIFFTPIDDNNTMIEVSSPSTYAKELISRRVFNFLDNKPDEQEKGAEQSHEEKSDDN